MKGGYGCRIVLLSLGVLLAGCEDEAPGGGPCDDVDCSGHGSCSVVEEEARCACDTGYHNQGPTSCVPDECARDSDCTDAGACQHRQCQDGLCQYPDAPDGTGCDDGVYCNGEDTCQGGACGAHAGDPCAGGAECNNLCNEIAGNCLVPAGQDCTDQAPDDCQAAQCDGAGQCQQDFADQPDGSDCLDDGLFCTGEETCQSGACESAGDPCPGGDCQEDQDRCASCGDGQVGPTEQCDPAAPSSSNCCHAGTCQWVPAGQADPQDVCSGAAECQLDVCDGSGGCSLVNQEDGTPCTDDGLYCTGVEACQSGACLSGGDPCPGPDGDDNCLESCNENAGNCNGPDPDGTACADDGVYCNGPEACQSGFCSGGGDPCDPGTNCDEDNQLCEVCGNGNVGVGEDCEPGSQHCCEPATCQWTPNGQPDPQSTCSGAPACKLDVCDGAGSCTLINQPDGNSCPDDGTYCNGPESCLGGDCLGGGSPCPGPDGDADCNESCNEGTESCDAADPDGEACLDDGEYCTGEETCQAGACLSAGDPCPVSGTCDEAGDLCDTCGDGLVSSWEDCDPDAGNHCCDPVSCLWVDAGQADPQAVCAGAPECQDDVCDGSGDCAFANQPDDTSCTDDLAFCTGEESCQSGICESAGDPCGSFICDEDNDRCLDDTWYGLGGSDLGPWWDFIPAGGATGGGISDNAGESDYASIAMDDSGNPVVAWQDDTSGNLEIYVRRFNGTDWEEVGTNSATGGGISDTAGESGQPAVVLDNLGHPVVAWQEGGSGFREIYIKRYTGAVWSEVATGSASGGGISQNSGDSTWVSLGIDTDNFPVVAWNDDSNSLGHVDIYVKRYTGADWVELGTGSASGTGISGSTILAMHPHLALDSLCNLVVVWQDYYDIYGKRYDCSEWEELDGSASGQGISQALGQNLDPRVVLNASGYPLVVWRAGTRMYGRRFNGNTWDELGLGGASGDGIHACQETCYGPVLALDGTGNPVVAWQEGIFGHHDILVKRLDVSSDLWLEVGTGSDSGHGVSNSDAQSNWPGLDANGGRMCATWTDTGENSREIVMRCADE